MARTITPINFGDIDRGTSLAIPLIFKRLDGTPFDLTGYAIHFTLKPRQWDHDYDDRWALVKKDVAPDARGTDGRLDIILSPADTWHDPGEYCFDIELTRGDAVMRIGIFNCNLVGGATNRTVNHNPDHIYFTDALNFTVDPFTSVIPFAVTTPLVADPPENIIETISVDPPYLKTVQDDLERNITLSVFGPRVSLPMTFRIAHDALEHNVRFDKFFIHALPEECPLKDAYLSIKNREFRIKGLSAPMKMLANNVYIMHSPETTYDGNSKVTDTDDFFFLGDNVDASNLNIIIYNNNDFIRIYGSYFMPDDAGDFEYWILSVDWFNWKD